MTICRIGTGSARPNSPVPLQKTNGERDSQKDPILIIGSPAGPRLFERVSPLFAAF